MSLKIDSAVTLLPHPDSPMMAREKQIEQVVFNRNGFLFHGRVKALAEAAREAGLRF